MGRWFEIPISILCIMLLSYPSALLFATLQISIGIQKQKVVTYTLYNSQ